MKRIYIYPTVFTFSLLLSGLMTVMGSPEVSAMSQAKCIENFQDETPAPSYFQTDCDKSKGGKCQIEQYGAGANSQGIDCNNSHTPVEPNDEILPANTAEECKDIDTNILKCDKRGGNPVMSLILQVINFMAIGVGIIVVGGIVWGAMLYTTSNGDSGKSQQGITTIVNAVIGLLLFVFTYAIINYLVPGGVL